MLKKLLLVVIVFAFASSFTLAGPVLTPEQLSKIQSVQLKVKVVGDAVLGVSNGPVSYGVKFPTPSKTGSTSDVYLPEGWIASMVKTQINNNNSMYDMCSNGTGQTFGMNPKSPNNLHYVHMYAPLGEDPATCPGRRTHYYYSTNKGTTWTFIGVVTDANARSGYGCLNFMTNGPALVACHTADGVSTQMSQAYVDAAEGLGSFNRLSPPLYTNPYIWPRIVSTSAITLTNKFIMISSVNSTAFDSALYIPCTSTTGTGTWAGWTPFESSSAECYQIARGSDGRIGVAYIAANTPNTLPDYGDVFFMESTNNGSSFGNPTKIYDCNFSVDSAGALRGIDLIYLGTSPKVTFEIDKQTNAGSYFPGDPNAKIRFWSNTLPGSDPNRSLVIADTSIVGYRPCYNTGASNDVQTPMCRPSIGVSGGVIFIAFQTPFGGNLPSGNVYVGGSVDTCSFNCVYLTASGNGGNSWKRPQMITPFDTTMTMKDWSWPNLSEFNDSISGSMYYANLSIFADSIPQTYYSHVANGEAISRIYHYRIGVAAPVFVKNISGEVPNGYSLYQNYPNPFNPTTNIRFALPKNSNVTLKIYNINGQLIETLMKDEMVNAGVNEVSFNAKGLASGIYFYSIETGSYKETRKMMLIK